MSDYDLIGPASGGGDVEDSPGVDVIDMIHVDEEEDEEADDDFIGPDDSRFVAVAKAAARKRRVASQPAAENSRVKRRRD